MRGNVGIWLGLFALLMFLPFMLMGLRPEMKWILVALVGVAIYNFVRMFLGDGWLTLGITAVLFYFLVWKHIHTAIFIWWLNVLIGLGVFSLVGWTYIGLRNILRR